MRIEAQAAFRKIALEVDFDVAARQALGRDLLIDKM